MTSEVEILYSEAITYTVDEIMNLLRLKPDPDELRKIHSAKEVFNCSKIIDYKKLEYYDK